MSLGPKGDFENRGRISKLSSSSEEPGEHKCIEYCINSMEYSLKFPKNMSPYFALFDSRSMS